MSIDDSEGDRGARLKYLRKMAKLTTGTLAEKLNLSRATISIWENASMNRGMTIKGAKAAIAFFNTVGIKCDIDWLWFGNGQKPDINETENMAGLTSSHLDNGEIRFFHTLHKNAVTVEITSKSMSPFYNPGDIVGGIWQPADLLEITEKNCIIEINKQLQVRRVKRIDDNYSVSFFSLCADENAPFQIDKITLEKIAVIKRVWSKL